LIEHPRLLEKVRERKIALELCPVSNYQTQAFKIYHGYKTKKISSAVDTHPKEYPLQKFLEHGLLITLNTDNRGISRTTLSEQFIYASNLSRNPLTKWDVLLLIKMGFKAAFLESRLLNQLLREVDKEIFQLLLQKE